MPPIAAIFAVLGLIWGSNFLFMKWASESITAGQVTLLRVVFGFLPVLAYAAARGMLSRAHLRHAHHFVVMSVLATSLYYFAFATGASLLPSGIAGALSGAIPLFSLLGAAIALRSERITARRVAGVLVGFGGVLLVARPWAAGGAVDMTGVLFMLLGSASVGLSFVYAKRFLTDLAIAPAALTTYQMGLGALTLAVLTDVEGITAVGGDAKALVGLVVGLGLLGTGVAYILYYGIVDRLGAVTASSATYLPPVVALGIGWLVADEAIAWWDGAGVALILAGVLSAGRLGEQPVEDEPHDVPAAALAVVGGHEAVADPQREGDHAAELDLGLVGAEGAELRAHVVHAAVVDTAQALGDGRVAARPVADREVDREDLVVGGGELEEPLDPLAPVGLRVGVDALDDLVDARALPRVEHLLEQRGAVREVPVEAALGDADRLGERLDPDGLRAACGKRA